MPVNRNFSHISNKNIFIIIKYSQPCLPLFISNYIKKMLQNNIFSGCDSVESKSRITFHKFPSKREFRENWIKACKSTLNPALLPSSSYLICSKHFKPCDFQQTKDTTKKLLKQGVTPSIFPWSSDLKKEMCNETKVQGHNSDVKVDELERQVEEKLEAIKAEIAASNLSVKKAPVKKSDKSNENPEELVDINKQGTDISSAVKKPSRNVKKKNSRCITVSSKKKNRKLQKFSKLFPKEIQSNTQNQFKHFSPGTKVILQDIDGQAQNAEILEMNLSKKEVLVRFERSKEMLNRSDEWVAIHQVKLSSSQNISEKNHFEVGDKVMAKWNDSRKFSATIRSIVSPDMCEVLFDDGYVKAVRNHCITKIKPSLNDSQHHKQNSSGIQLKEDPEISQIQCVEIPNIPQDGEWCCYWINDSPVGKKGSLNMNHGILNTVIVEDWRLPEGWTKHLYQRVGNYGGKWDTIIVSPEGLNFRTKHELKAFFDKNGKVYDFNVFDFCLHKKRAKEIGLVAYTADYKNPQNTSAADKDGGTVSYSSHNECDLDSKDVYLGTLKVKTIDNLFICPSCEKSFRKEKHLQIHVKHYHPDLSDFLGFVPNMQDLAYKRTVENDKTDKEKDCNSRTLRNTTQRISSLEVQPDLKIPSKLTTEIRTDKIKVSTSSNVIIKRPSDSLVSSLNKNNTTSVKRSPSDTSFDDQPNKKIRHNTNETKAVYHNIAEKQGRTYINEYGEVIKIVRMRKEEVINCVCGYPEEDGLMIQCELCLCWQHGFCNSILKVSEVPDKYVCLVCQNPERNRVSSRFVHDQDWLYDGTLYHTRYHIMNVAAKDENIARVLQKKHKINGNLLELAKFLKSTDIKLSISENKHHPKMYLWSKAWDTQFSDVNQTTYDNTKKSFDKKPKKFTEDKYALSSKLYPKEVAIDSLICQKNLFAHLKAQQNAIMNKLQDLDREITGKGNLSSALE